MAPPSSSGSRAKGLCLHAGATSAGATGPGALAASLGAELLVALESHTSVRELSACVERLVDCCGETASSLLGVFPASKSSRSVFIVLLSLVRPRLQKRAVEAFYSRFFVLALLPLFFMLRRQKSLPWRLLALFGFCGRTCGRGQDLYALGLQPSRYLSRSCPETGRQRCAAAGAGAAQWAL